MAEDLTLELVAGLGNREQRRERLRQLAQHFAAEDVLLLVRDPELGGLIPAPGCPATLSGGPLWRNFLGDCRRPGMHRREVDLPRDTLRAAFGLSSGDMAFVVLGGQPPPPSLAVLEQLLPLTGAMLLREQESLAATAEVARATVEAERAHALSLALERARAEGALLNAELQEQHRRKDEFLAMLAHELRNPLSPLLMSIEVLRRIGDSAPLRGRQLQMMERQVRQLVRLVDDLLDVSRVSRGRIELRRAVLPLATVLHEAVEAIRPLLEARGHRLELDMDSGELRVQADAVRLHQVFSNLLHNAAKYTDPGGRIVLGLSHEDGEAVVRLSDNGSGIAPEVLPRIFDLFEQAPVSLARSEGGLGIGLTLVRTLVELHGGRVNAESAGLGQGSTFTVRLPLAQGALDAQETSEPPRARTAAVRRDHAETARRWRRQLGSC